MSGKYSQEQQTCDLSLKFFSSSSTQTSRPSKKWVISPPLAKATGHRQRNARFPVECDCACR
jgi:hypothetical protein